jgi:hypothetical protein
MLAESSGLMVDPDPEHQATSSQTATQTRGSTALVMDGLLQLTNNVDRSQPVPDDQPQAILRHVRAEIRNANATYPVPYLSTSIDLLLDGRPVISSLALEPMVAAESATPDLYYGNNVRLVQRGTYQLFVRVQPNALLGNDPLPAAQFNMVVR